MVIYSIMKLCVGRIEYLCKPVFAYCTDKFLRCDDIVAVIGAGAGML